MVPWVPSALLLAPVNTSHLDSTAPAQPQLLAETAR